MYKCVYVLLYITNHHDIFLTKSINTKSTWDSILHPLHMKSNAFAIEPQTLFELFWYKNANFRFFCHKSYPMTTYKSRFYSSYFRSGINVINPQMMTDRTNIACKQIERYLLVFDWYIYIWSWSNLKVKVKVINIFTVNILQTVTNSAQLLLPTHRKLLIGFQLVNLISSNYLTLNPSKTEFLLIGLPQQISKIVNSLSFPANP